MTLFPLSVRRLAWRAPRVRRKARVLLTRDRCAHACRSYHRSWCWRSGLPNHRAHRTTGATAVFSATFDAAACAAAAFDAATGHAALTAVAAAAARRCRRKRNGHGLRRLRPASGSLPPRRPPLAAAALMSAAETAGRQCFVRLDQDREQGPRAAEASASSHSVRAACACCVARALASAPVLRAAVMMSPHCMHVTSPRYEQHTCYEPSLRV